jgi:hypothetical protein
MNAFSLLAPVLAGAGALALAGCATTASDGSAAFGGKCKAEPAQRFVGEKADVAHGLTIQQVTGAELLRWAPPRSALTMDFREERVTIAYDDAMVITMITCG